MMRKQQVSRKKPAATGERAAEAPDQESAAATAQLEAAPAPDEPGPPDATGPAVLAADPLIVADPLTFAEPVIVIEIDPVVTGGYVHGRFDVMIRGRVVSAAPIEEIRLQVDDWIISFATYGQPERAAAGMMPDGTEGRQRGFQFNLPRPGDGRTEQCGFQIIARAVSGFEYAEDFEIEVDPAAADQVSVIAGPTRPVTGVPRPYAVMYIERGSIDPDGILTVKGWAVSLGRALAIQIFADEERLSKAKIGGERGDVESVFPGYPNARQSGFSLTLELEEVNRGAKLIRAQMVCPNGFAHEESIPVERLERRGASAGAPGTDPSQAFSLFSHQAAYQVSADFRIAEDPRFGLLLPGSASEPRIVSSLGPSPAETAAARFPGLPQQQDLLAEIRMHCDAVALTGDGILSLDGWALCGIGIVQVRVLLNDEDVGLASIGYERSDVREIFPEIPLSHLSGFRFEQRIGERFEGEYQVRIVVRNMRDEEIGRQIPVVATEVVTSERAPPSGFPGMDNGPELTFEQTAEFRFEQDSPEVSNGTAVAMVTGRLTIDGWLLTRSGIASFEVCLDGQRLGDAHYGLARQDVGAAFPEWPNSLRSGYAFHCPPRSLRDGEHVVELRIRANNDLELIRSFRITVKKADDQQDSAGIRRRIPRVEADMMAGFLADMEYRPAFQFILRQDGPLESERWRATLDALRFQAYADWTVLVLAGDDDTGTAITGVVDVAAPDLASRFTVISPSNSEVWSGPLVDADARSGDGPVLHLPLLPGDEPGADALLELAVASGRHPDRDLLYGDEVRQSPVSKETEHFFKPDFSPDLLLSTNYIGRPWVATAALLAETGATAASLIANGEYDLLLRCVECATAVHHVPKLLCQRSVMDIDDPGLQQVALERALDRRDIAGEVLATAIEGTWRVKRAMPSRGKVSIIIPTCAAQGYIETCISSLRGKTAYRDFEIVCVDNIPRTRMAWKVWLQQNADKVIDIADAFNWSKFNNRACEVADGEFLLFLNDDIEVIQGDWLDAMMEHAQRPEVGITGPQLLYRDGNVQHAGMFLSNNGIGRHAFRFSERDDPGYFGLALTQRNVIAVTGACMLVRRETFERLGRFEEAHEIINNDLDFCLRAHRAGLLTVFTPYATLTHHELASRANLREVFDLTHFNAAWKTTFAQGDPYFNPRLSRHHDDYRPDDEPVQWVVSGTPMFQPSEIQRILVVKLDHIGDFVTALPPIRRLKKLFPHARITVLAGPASRAFIALESCIDEFIPFAFFHVRSQLGQRDLTKEDYAELADQLRPYRFDLAVDLRKHPSTRDVLKYTGARFLAGFDYLGQFPYLDIALDWDGDRTLQRKRSHIVDDLMALVNAIGHASESDRILIQPGPAAMPLTELPDQVQALFAKPVVAIHAGAGNVTKQWPEVHFSALIDLLIEKNDVNILLVGGPDEADVATVLLGSVQRNQSIGSMVGKTSLSDLPRLLKNCALYIGNDSGPKHIAAAVGIPTVGIHSGVVDPVEWGPIGLNAVALRRNMTCSPCYLAKADDCPRSLACLQFFEPNLVYETADLLLKRSGPVIVAEKVKAEPVEAEWPNVDVEPLEAAAFLAAQAEALDLSVALTVEAEPWDAGVSTEGELEPSEAHIPAEGEAGLSRADGPTDGGLESSEVDVLAEGESEWSEEDVLAEGGAESPEMDASAECGAELSEEVVPAEGEAELSEAAAPVDSEAEPSEADTRADAELSG